VDIYGGLCGKISAINLKEIEVKFNNKVDETSATDVSNYSTTAGAIADGGIELSEDGKSVTISLAKGTVMDNQKEYKLSISKVKDATGTQVVSISEQKFSVLDNTLPQIVEAKALGNKVIKLYASEPIKEATSSMFKIDGKSFFGTVNVNPVNNKEIVLKPYNTSTVLSVGEHTITVAKLKDYADFVSLQQEIKINVVEDKAAPNVVDTKATLEQATITFDEDIDPATVSKTDFFWKSGSLKKYASGVSVSGNKVVVDFSANPLPAYATTLYIGSIADYCGNALSDAEISITASVDQLRPEVVSVKVEDDHKSVTVKFNKNVTGADKSKYEIKDEDGDKVAIKDVTGTGKVYVISLYYVLPEGVNTLTVSGIADTTTLKNVMLPFSTALDEVGDETSPTVIGKSGNGRQIMVTFSEVMDLASIADPDNYLIEFAGSYIKLPAETELTPIQDGKAVLIVLPEKIGTTTVAVGTANNVTKLQIMGVEDIAGNSVEPYIETVDLKDPLVSGKAGLAAYSTSISDPAILADGKTIKVRFSQPIGVADATDFTIAGATIEAVETNETPYVTLLLKDSIGTAIPTDLTLKTATSNKMETVTGNGVKDGLTINVADQVAPEVKLADNVTTLKLTQTDKDTVTIEVPFSETLDTTGTDDYAQDLIVTKSSDSKEPLVPKTDYTTTVTGNVITIKLKAAALDNSKYTVSVKLDAKYIVDENNNKAAASDTIETNKFVDAFADKPAVKVDGVTDTAATVKVTASEAGKVYIVNQLESTTAPTDADAVKTGDTTPTTVTADTEVADAQSGLTANKAYTVYVVFADSLGNLSDVVSVDYTTSLSAAPDAPAYTINYADETTTENIPATVEYATDAAFTTPTDGTGAVAPVTPGTPLYFRVKATETAPAGAVQTLSVTGRPAAPAVTSDDTANTVSGIDGTMEFSIDGATWTTYNATTPNLPVLTGTVTLRVRVKATSTTFSSEVKTLNFNV
jgi:hypothetical protein